MPHSASLRAARGIAAAVFAAMAACHNPTDAGGGGNGAVTSLAGRIAFSRTAAFSSPGEFEIKPDGTAGGVLFTPPAFSFAIANAVSADGHVLAIELQFSNLTQIVLADLRTGAITPFPADQVHGYGAPSWSPGGGQIAFQDGTDGSTVFIPTLIFGRVLVANADGSGMVAVGDSAILGSAVTWSHDGTHILYSRVGKLVSVMANGSTVNPVAIGSADSVLDPALSPDGTKIAFANGWPAQTVITVMNADGSAPMPVATSMSGDRHPAWSPSGAQLAIERYATLTVDAPVIVVMGSTGTDTLTVSPAGSLFEDHWPAWGPAAP